MLQLFKRNSFMQKSSKWFSYLSMPWKLVIYSLLWVKLCKIRCMSVEMRKLSKLPSFYPCNIEKRGKKNVGHRWPTHWTRVAMTTVWNGKKGEQKRFLGHFRVVPSLCFKAKLSAKPLTWRWVLHKKGFTLNLVLKVRVFGTRKWPILPVLARKKNSLDNFVV